MTAIVEKLKKTGAKLIFATTTPVTPGTTDPLREPEGPVKYNEAGRSEFRLYYPQRTTHKLPHETLVKDDAL